MKTIKQLMDMVEARSPRSAWGKGVNEYAYELLEKFSWEYGLDFEFYGSPADKKALLNGAENWNQYSYGGCSLIYDSDIAERLLTPSGLKKKKGGKLMPNQNENYLDIQAKALLQAQILICSLAKKA